MALRWPTVVILDADGNLYIVDSGNHRIVAFGQNGLRCVIEYTTSTNSASNKIIFSPESLSFDSDGNIFTADWENNRIQKFHLETNFCDKYPPPTIFVPTCKRRTSTGVNCSDLKSPCKMKKPCQNHGTCIDDDTISVGFICQCLSDFGGNVCQNDNRPDKPKTCWNNGAFFPTTEISDKLCCFPFAGIYVSGKNKMSQCQCQNGWEGDYCERKINNCTNVKCLNKGVCRPLLMNYTCECLGDSYSGRHCEITAPKIKIYVIVSKSFAYVGIIAMISVAMFIVIMDILKYCFGIDPVHDERERIRRKKRAKNCKPVIQRFVYINTPQPLGDLPTSTTEETV